MVGRRKGSGALTPLEMQILQVLWRAGPSNVQQVQAALAAENELAYNTVQTMLNVLCRKSRVERRLAGRAYVYAPTADRESVVGQALRDFVERMFRGSPEELVMSLIKNKQVDAKQLMELGRRFPKSEGGEEDE